MKQSVIKLTTTVKLQKQKLQEQKQSLDTLLCPKVEVSQFQKDIAALSHQDLSLKAVLMLNKLYLLHQLL